MTKTILLFSSLILSLFSVERLSVPGNGISPQCVTDSRGVTHMIFYMGEPLKGNLFYCTKKKNETKFSQYGIPIQINSKFGTAVSMGTIRAGQMAIGKDGVIHVVWNGSPQAKGQLLYTRKVEEKPFTRQINLMGNTSHLDGGASVAANDQGGVHVVWHANSKGTEGEANRKVFVASSKDNGASFQPERIVSPADLGVCACCSLKAFSKGNMLGILFRGAKGENRDVYQLASRDNGSTFKSRVMGKWQAKMCPMSSQSISFGRQSFLTAWESEGKIFFTNPFFKTIQVPGGGNRKHPLILQNSKQELLVAWAEGTGWQKGGDLCWQKFSSAGKPVSKVERVRKGIKVWSVFSGFVEGEKFFLVH